MKRPAALLLALAAAGPAACAGTRDAIPVYGYAVVHAYPHDTNAYTEGLFYLDGHLYESTGQVGASTVRKVDLATGKVLQQADTPWPDYGEGSVAWQDKLIQLTWRNHEGFVYDLATLKPLARFAYPGEGWALTTDGSYLYMSDGTPVIRRLDPNTLQQVGSIHVTADGKPLENINELEWVKGQLFANVWLTTHIARIDPASGKVVGWIELGGLVPKADSLGDPVNDVLNGIAYDAKHDRLFVTGKCWPKLYEIRLTGPARER
ncbi:glutaminyl-peptide cyclotransferase [Fulvimonas sp. R45]|uniref:glutaminyl-peptide cyclotransferase n=1 Tax=Fulvimonas sp. R45 TaxID=3045937 RepID=UPI00265E69CB|nr:glutaminyl-peptide cyclotransferase [Fulvimonas sp. R45]MDO1529986.1 glutaminyl-peptide cyclotransferase [Fulvimonas sp. R45]